MHLCFLATGFSDYSVEAATALAAHCQVTLLIDRNHLEKDSDRSKWQALAKRGRLRTFRQHRLPFRVAMCASVVSDILRLRPDGVILHEHAHPHIAWLHRQISRIAPTLLIVHDPAPHSGNDSVLATRNRRSIDIERRAASGFLVHGDYCRTLLRAQMPDDSRQISTIPHGPVLRPASPAAPPTSNRILMFGRMEAYKGLDVLLDALPSLADRGIELRLAGNGPELDRLAPEFRRHAGVSIRQGFVPRDEALREFADSAVVVAPYTEATQSGVVAAAFASGRPVVASRVGGLPDFITDDRDGILLPPGDPTSLAEALSGLLADRDRLSRLSAGASETISTGMSWTRFADIVLSQVTPR